MDKRGKETGRGQVSSIRYSGQHDVGYTASLYNYNLDGNLLKPEHKEWLDHNVVRFVGMVPDCHVALHGVASRVGDAEYNRILSTERVLRVKKYLIEHGLSESQVPGTQLRATGEDELPADHGADDARSRAVYVRVVPRRLSQPIPEFVRFPPVDIHGVPVLPLPPDKIRGRFPPIEPPEFHPVPTKYSSTFRIRLNGSVEAGVLKGYGANWGGSGIVFEIVDLENRRRAYAVLPARRLAPNTPGGSPVTYTHKGKWAEFRPSKPRRIEDLRGMASWTPPIFAEGRGTLAFRSWVPGTLGIFAEEHAKIPPGPSFGGHPIADASNSEGILFISEPKPY